MINDKTAIEYLTKLEDNELSQDNFDDIKKKLEINDYPQDLLDRYLLYYASRNKYDETKFLINSGVNVNSNNNGYVFRIVVRCGYTDIVKLFIDAGLNITIFDDLIMIIASSNYVDIMKIFLLELPMSNIIRMSYNHALLSACRCGYLQMVQLLLDFGTDINYANGLPLIQACCTNNFDVAKYLINIGVNVCVQSNRPILEVIKNENLDMAQLLLDAGASINNPCLMEFAIDKKSDKIINFLKKNGLNNSTTSI